MSTSRLALAWSVRLEAEPATLPEPAVVAQNAAVKIAAIFDAGNCNLASRGVGKSSRLRLENLLHLQRRGVSIDQQRLRLDALARVDTEG
jgi:hypothetical protein